MSGLVAGIMKNTDKINREILIETCGISNEDIFIVNWFSELLTPGYFLVVDHKKSSIVITIRGSFELKDAIPDLIAHKVEFLVKNIFFY